MLDPSLTRGICLDGKYLNYHLKTFTDSRRDVWRGEAQSAKVFF
jgi:hypothetical protein